MAWETAYARRLQRFKKATLYSGKKNPNTIRCKLKLCSREIRELARTSPVVLRSAVDCGHTEDTEPMGLWTLMI